MIDISKYQNISKDSYDAFAGPDWPPYDQFIEHKNVETFVYEEIDNFLANYTPFNNPAFCVLPFYGIEYPGNVHCCIMESTNVDQVKQQMLNGVRPTACSVCWKLEDAGIVSDRIQKNNTFDHYSNRDLNFLYEDAKQQQATIASYKIDTSTVCNATCVTCSGRLSSSWRQLEKENNVFSQRIPIITNSQTHQLIDFPTAKMINFRGGEPFLSKTNFYILEKLIEVGNTDCFISFTTNGSIIPNAKQIEILSKFKHVDFDISIDGLGLVFEYLRYPLSWKSVLATIDFCRAHGFTVSASYTISNLNVLYHSQTTQWFTDNGINYTNNLVNYPEHFQPSALPQAIKSKILSHDSNPDLLLFLGKHSESDDSNFEKFQTEIAKQDSWKKININNFLPEFIKLINTQ
jgi:hypothetical protein